MRRIRQAFGRPFAEINPVYARILGQLRVGGWPALRLVGLGLGFTGHGAWKEQKRRSRRGTGEKGGARGFHAEGRGETAQGGSTGSRPVTGDGVRGGERRRRRRTGEAEHHQEEEEEERQRARVGVHACALTKLASLSFLFFYSILMYR